MVNVSPYVLKVFLIGIATVIIFYWIYNNNQQRKTLTVITTFIKNKKYATSESSILSTVFILILKQFTDRFKFRLQIFSWVHLQIVRPRFEPIERQGWAIRFRYVICDVMNKVYVRLMSLPRKRVFTHGKKYTYMCGYRSEVFWLF